MWFLKYFTDPLLQASMVGSILMCVASSLMGVLAFVRRESLVGETLSHAAFPGTVVGVALGATFFPFHDSLQLIATIVGAFIFSLLGMGVVTLLQRRYKVKEDSALCFVLSTFMGGGVFLASMMQSTHPLWYRQVNTFFFGQVATLMDVHVVLYAILALSVALFVIWKFPLLKMVHFDRTFSQSLGVNMSLLNGSLIVFFTLSVVIGIKAVGVVLMSGMLVAPAIAARKFTTKLSSMLIVAVIFGALSAMLGNIVSYEIPLAMINRGLAPISLPTGPLILLIAALFSLLALLFAPKQGVVYRAIRIQRFQMVCFEENFIKSFWKNGLECTYLLPELQKRAHLGSVRMWCFLTYLKYRGEMGLSEGGWRLTSQGQKRARHIVRLHRLFELYLSSHLNVKGADIHNIAEEMEHLITPEIEKELTAKLDNPTSDPHEQPIPRGLA